MGYHRRGESILTFESVSPSPAVLTGLTPSRLPPGREFHAENSPRLTGPLVVPAKVKLGHRYAQDEFTQTLSWCLGNQGGFGGVEAEGG